MQENTVSPMPCDRAQPPLLGQEPGCSMRLSLPWHSGLLVLHWCSYMLQINRSKQQPLSHNQHLHNNIKNGRINLKRHRCNLEIMYAANSAGRN